jgi:hypothetical protein
MFLYCLAHETTISCAVVPRRTGAAVAQTGSELANGSELADTFASMTASEWAAFFITEIHSARRPIAWFQPSHRWKPRESCVFSQAARSESWLAPGPTGSRSCVNPTLWRSPDILQHSDGSLGISRQPHRLFSSPSCILRYLFDGRRPYGLRIPGQTVLRTFLQADHAAANEKAMDAAKSIGVTPPDAPKREAKGRLRKDVQEIAGGKLAHQQIAPTASSPRDITNHHESDVDGPIRHAKPDWRTHIQEVRRTLAVSHRPGILQPLFAAALQRWGG